MRRRPLLAAGASAVAAVAIAGCLDGTGSDSTTDGTDEPSATAPSDTDASPSTASTTEPSTATRTDESPAKTTTEPSTGGRTTEATDGRGMHEPESNLEVGVANNYDEAVTVAVTVTRQETGEVVHESTHDLDPDGFESVYDLADADPDGVEPFEIAGESDGLTARETVETSACYGDANVTREYDGGLSVGYAIC